MNVCEKVIRDELTFWPGVDVRFGPRSKHCEAVFHYRGATRFVVYSTTPSDNQRSHLNCLSDVRAELRTLGAERKAKRLKKRKRARVIGRQMPRPPQWVARIPLAPVKPNPFEALSALQFAAQGIPTREGGNRATGLRSWVARSLKAMRQYLRSIA